MNRRAELIIKRDELARLINLADNTGRPRDHEIVAEFMAVDKEIARLNAR
jgi:hypothetical protein